MYSVQCTYSLSPFAFKVAKLIQRTHVDLVVSEKEFKDNV